MLLAGPWPCFGQNLAQNPGFETGDTSGWFAFGTSAVSAQSAQVHSGAYAALVQNRTATWNGIAQSLAGVLQPGQTYSLSVWVRLAAGPAQTVQLTIKKTDANGDQYTALGSTSASTNGWAQIAGQYTLSVAGTLSGLTLYAEVPTSATASYYLDDLSLVLPAPPPGTDGIVTVDWTDLHQRIDGFGASSAWRSTWTSQEADMFFSTNTGLGLTLLRTRIAPGGGTVESSIMQMARDRGARVWSAPWSPQTTFKTPNAGGVISLNGGGFAGTTANYQAYANQLAGYVAKMKSQYGVNLYALSLQNEPDFNTTNYESCVWTAQQIHDFVPYLSAALAASNAASTRLIIPESDVWSGNTGLYTTALNDAAVAPLVSVVANHNYVANNNAGDQAMPAALSTYGKALWETEVSTFNAFDASINNGLYWAVRIHSFLTVAQVNAWHYWWLVAAGTDNSGLASSSDVLAKRAYVLGQYSRFVRPDFYRIGVVTNQGPVLVSAFKDPLSLSFALVAVNPASGVVTQTFNFTHVTRVATVTPWITSASQSLASQSAVTLTDNSFSYVLPAQSVSTFVGQASNTAPSFAGLTLPTCQAGVTLLLTNSASDPDAPPQSLTYELLQGPTNATLDASNGLLAWRPSVNQAGTTNLVVLTVADNGSPPLSATNSYSLVVAPLQRPTLSPSVDASGQLLLTVAGNAGPDYTLLTSTNLLNWEPVLKSNSPPLPFTFTLTNPGEPQRFYRIQLGP